MAPATGAVAGPEGRRPSLQPLAPVGGAPLGALAPVGGLAPVVAAPAAEAPEALEQIGQSGRIGRELSAPHMMAPRDTQEGFARLLAPAGFGAAVAEAHAEAEKEE